MLPPGDINWQMIYLNCSCYCVFWSHSLPDSSWCPYHRHLIKYRDQLAIAPVLLWMQVLLVAASTILAVKAVIYITVYTSILGLPSLSAHLACLYLVLVLLPALSACLHGSFIKVDFLQLICTKQTLDICGPYQGP